ncbi:MAG: hypothetical protein KA803_07385 [Rhodoferax sp.]|nr:hypothetical protein [Rhodoferax sp.]
MVVEGLVEATMDSRVIQISERGQLTGEIVFGATLSAPSLAHDKPMLAMANGT